MTAPFDSIAARAHLVGHARRIGRGLVNHALKLWFTVQSPSTPAAVKAPLIAALVYVGLPVDAVPDMLPLVGFSDDAAVVAAALAAAHAYITDDITAKAEATTRALFREAAPCGAPATPA